MMISTAPAARLPPVRGPAVQRELEWQTQYDGEGRPFYFCVETEEVSWTRPGEEWSQSFDAHGRTFWINKDGLTSFEDPTGGQAGPAPDPEPPQVTRSFDASPVVQVARPEWKFDTPENLQRAQSAPEDQGSQYGSARPDSRQALQRARTDPRYEREHRDDRSPAYQDSRYDDSPRDERRSRDDRYSARDGRSAREDDRYGRDDDRYSARDSRDRYSARDDDRYSARESRDRISARDSRERYSGRDGYSRSSRDDDRDRYSARDDRYSARDDRYSARDDRYSARDRRDRSRDASPRDRGRSPRFDDDDRGRYRGRPAHSPYQPSPRSHGSARSFERQASQSARSREYDDRYADRDGYEDGYDYDPRYAAQPAVEESQSAGGQWVPYVDDATGLPYWYHTGTGETRWDASVYDQQGRAAQAPRGYRDYEAAYECGLSDGSEEELDRKARSPTIGARLVRLVGQPLAKGAQKLGELLEGSPNPARPGLGSQDPFDQTKPGRIDRAADAVEAGLSKLLSMAETQELGMSRPAPTARQEERRRRRDPERGPPPDTLLDRATDESSGCRAMLAELKQEASTFAYASPRGAPGTPTNKPGPIPAPPPVSVGPPPAAAQRDWSPAPCFGKPSVASPRLQPVTSPFGAVSAPGSPSGEPTDDKARGRDASPGPGGRSEEVQSAVRRALTPKRVTAPVAEPTAPPPSAAPLPGLPEPPGPAGPPGMAPPSAALPDLPEPTTKLQEPDLPEPSTQ